MLAVTNTIVRGHLTVDLANVPTNAAGGFDHFSHSLYGTASTGGVSVDMHEIEGCIVGDPMFIGDGDYRLQQVVSPCIDAGVNLPWMHGAKDIQGFSRIMYGVRAHTVDMGAYETAPVPGTKLQVR